MGWRQAPRLPAPQRPGDAIAARAGADHRPILAWLRGERDLPRGIAGERIARAANELGIQPTPSKPTPPRAA